MIQALADKVWSNPRFHEASKRVELAWLTKDLGVERPAISEEDDPRRLMQAAAVLACSANYDHRRAAFRAATCTFELFGSETLPLDQALRVVLARLGNFPSFDTRSEVKGAMPFLPLSLAAEELISTDARTIKFNEQSVCLTDFQHSLWTSLVARRRVALAAPTSTGKSFVLQAYLSSLFKPDASDSVVYIVPTRALIAQVAEDVAEQFRGLGLSVPNIVTVPIDSDAELLERTIYVMTQERVQLALSSHATFSGATIIVDEAHAIADGSRGVLLQWVIDELLERNPDAQTLFASPTIRNLDVFGRLFGLTDVIEFASVEPTVAQNFLTVAIESATKGKVVIRTVGDGLQVPREVARLELNQTTASRIDKLVHISATLGRGQSNIIYANGAAEAENIAIQLADLLSNREVTPNRLALAELATDAVHPQFVLAECVKRGVAFHYSNVPTQVRRAIESGAARGDIDYLVCTSTLLQGVNLPAKNIFMCLPEKGNRRPLESTDFWNLSGRAGRLRREFQGNIFLIDYDHWKKKPLDGPKDSVIVPAMETSIKEHEPQLLSLIGGNERTTGGDGIDLETTFVRLYSDHKLGGLTTTLERIGVSPASKQAMAISEALTSADLVVNLPAQLLRQSPNISAHKQQTLYDRLKSTIHIGRDAAKSLLPKHPREREAFDSYAGILKLCHELILGLDTTRGLHRFHAVVAIKWMSGLSLPQIIEEQIRRNPTKNARTTIRQTLDLIEGQIRFQAVRLIGCYSNLLVYALENGGLSDLVSSIPALPLYLEVGASDKTMISFISLGLSRVTAMKLNEQAARKDMDLSAAREWLRNRPLETLGLSVLLQSEVRAVIDG
jgi:superfamily II DNA/RNA helicase